MCIGENKITEVKRMHLACKGEEGDLPVTCTVME